MVLSNTPPAGAGQVHRVTKTDQLLKIIDGLGLDNNFNPVGIRTKALAEVSGVPANSISVLLTPHVNSGRLCVCKITVPGSPPQNEYRKGIGVPMPEFKPLNTRKAGIALGTPAHRGGTAKAPPLSTPAPVVTAIVPPTFIKPQPAVGSNTGSAIPVPPASAGDRAVAAGQATPKPAARARLKEEPAATKASAGDALRINIDDDGTLIIATAEDVIELDIDQALRLGDFMHATQGVWRP